MTPVIPNATTPIAKTISTMLKLWRIFRMSVLLKLALLYHIQQLFKISSPK